LRSTKLAIGSGSDKAGPERDSATRLTRTGRLISEGSESVVAFFSPSTFLHSDDKVRSRVVVNLLLGVHRQKQPCSWRGPPWS
jgi:hypothetical protein